MTVSYRKTPDSQEPEPQRSGVQQAQNTGARPGADVTGNPQPLPPSIRRKVVGKPPVNPPVGNQGYGQTRDNGETNDQYSQNMIAPPSTMNNSMVPTQSPAPLIQTVSPQNAQSLQTVQTRGETNQGRQIPQAGMASTRQPLLRQEVTPRSSNTSVANPQEIENGNIILYRSPNFFLRTAYRPAETESFTQTYR
ncbi:MAG: hypothetical protein ACXWPS_06750 [Ktedonobacteraceae bacterium]